MHWNLFSVGMKFVNIYYKEKDTLSTQFYTGYYSVYPVFRSVPTFLNFSIKSLSHQSFSKTKARFILVSLSFSPLRFFFFSLPFFFFLVLFEFFLQFYRGCKYCSTPSWITRRIQKSAYGCWSIGKYLQYLQYRKILFFFFFFKINLKLFFFFLNNKENYPADAQWAKERNHPIGRRKRSIAHQN